MGKPLAGLGGVAALFTMGTGAAADVGDGGEAKTWTLTQRVGNPSFLSLPVSFSAFLLVPLNREGVNTQLMEAHWWGFGDGRVDSARGQLRSGEQAVSLRLLWRKSATREGCFWSLFAIGAAGTACSFSALLLGVVLFVVLCRAVVFFLSTLCTCRADAGALFAFGFSSFSFVVVVGPCFFAVRVGPFFSSLPARRSPVVVHGGVFSLGMGKTGCFDSTVLHPSHCRITSEGGLDSGFCLSGPTLPRQE